MAYCFIDVRQSSAAVVVAAIVWVETSNIVNHPHPTHYCNAALGLPPEVHAIPQHSMSSMQTLANRPAADAKTHMQSRSKFKQVQTLDLICSLMDSGLLQLANHALPSFLQAICSHQAQACVAMDALPDMRVSLTQLEWCLAALQHCSGTTHRLRRVSRRVVPEQTVHKCHAEQLQQAMTSQQMSQTLQQSRSPP